MVRLALIAVACSAAWQLIWRQPVANCPHHDPAECEDRVERQKVLCEGLVEPTPLSTTAARYVAVVGATLAAREVAAYRRARIPTVIEAPIADSAQPTTDGSNVDATDSAKTDHADDDDLDLLDLSTYKPTRT